MKLSLTNFRKSPLFLGIAGVLFFAQAAFALGTSFGSIASSIQTATPTIAFVQAAGHKDTTSTNTITLSSTTTGNAIIVPVDFYSSHTINVTSVTDNQSNTYSQVSGARANGTGTTASDLWYCLNCTGGVTSVVVHLSTTGNTAVAALEFSGVATSSAIDVSNSLTGSGITQNGPSITTTVAGDLIVANGGNDRPWVTYNNYTQSPADPAYAVMDGELSAYLITTNTVTGSQLNVTLSNSGATWASSAAAFKAR